MSKVKTHSIDVKERYKIVGDFFELISGLGSKKEIIDFFIGLLTQSEILMLARRIQIARMIISGNGYEEIMKKLKVGSQTISKTERWIYGRGEEYSVWITKCLKHLSKKENKKNFEYSTSMLNKYPSCRFLKELLD